MTSLSIFTILLTDGIKLNKFEPALISKNPETGTFGYLGDQTNQSQPLPEWWKNEWKSYGKVQVEVINNNNGNGLSVVIRQEETMKVLSNIPWTSCCNFQLHPSNSRSVMWTGKDYSAINGVLLLHLLSHTQCN